MEKTMRTHSTMHCHSKSKHQSSTGNFDTHDLDIGAADNIGFMCSTSPAVGGIAGLGPVADLR